MQYLIEDLLVPNVSVVEKVGEQAATSLSHGKLLLRYEKLSYLRIRPNFLNHVLCTAVFCVERFLVFSGRERFFAFQSFSCSKHFSRPKKFSTVARWHERNFFERFLGNAFRSFFKVFKAVIKFSAKRVGFCPFGF